ncbi:unnamed protein product [Phaedon cochleariae]|uniref:Uncharacterized protein n=1 Tax=Phaedon cochleariae TaxID=80249 RepID=A0A9N9X0T2_PHACE|nr:unnamed protein product [Phaedon cochleariae]
MAVENKELSEKMAIVSSSIISSLSYPNAQYVPASSPETHSYPIRNSHEQHQQHQQQQQQFRVERKFAEKPNAIKKVALDDLNDIETNQISESSGGGGFTWSNLLVVMGGRNPEQINMMAKQANEFIGIVMNLLEALKTSFSHRSMAARHLGRKDSVSDAAVAGVAMMKGYLRSVSNGNEKCMQRYVCEANSECSKDIGQSSLFCHLGSYAVSFILDKSAPTTSFEMLYEAGRKGRFGDNCHEKYLECNEV